MKNLYIGLALITGFTFASCRKSRLQPAPVAPTVYVAGYEQNSSNILVAKVWKNGVATNISDGIHAANAVSMYVNGTDVYTTGWETNGNFAVATVWKNGVATNLTDGTYDGFPSSVYVNGTDVYVVGYTQNSSSIWTAILWKNGVA